jgi:hypothetical protein
VSLDEALRERTLAHMIRRSDAALIVYDAADPQTFRVACQLRDRVQRVVGGAGGATGGLGREREEEELVEEDQ